MTNLVNKLILIASILSASFNDDFDKTITNISDPEDFDIKLEYKKKLNVDEQEGEPEQEEQPEDETASGIRDGVKFTLTYKCKNNLNDKEVKHDKNVLDTFLKRTFKRATDGSQYSSQDAEIVLNTVNECKFNIIISGANEFSDYKDDIVEEFIKELKDKKEDKKAGSPSNIPDGMKQEMDNMVDILIDIKSDGNVNQDDVGRSGLMLVTLIDRADPDTINASENDEDTSIDTIASVEDITKNITGDEATIEELVNALKDNDDLKVELGVTFDTDGDITKEQLEDITKDIKGAVDSITSEHIDGTPISGKILLFRDWKKWTAETAEEDPESNNNNNNNNEGNNNEGNNNNGNEEEDPDADPTAGSSPGDFHSSSKRNLCNLVTMFFL